jgi:hypothetical protein
MLQLEKLGSGILTDIGLSRTDLALIRLGDEDEIHPAASRTRFSGNF